MKRKEAIKQTQEGKAQVFNDLLPSTKEIKKFLKEAFPEDKYYITHPNGECYDKKIFHNLGSKRWTSRNVDTSNLPIINLSTITKRKKAKLSQLEALISDVVKDVAELRQTLAKDVEAVVEEVKTELVVGEWYNVFYQEANEQWGLIEIQSIQDERINYRGFYKQDWNEDWCHPKNKFIKATPQEVETALVNEAKKRGYKEGVLASQLHVISNKIISSNPSFVYTYAEDRLFYGGSVIYLKGIWAEIQQETIKEEVIDWNVPQLVINKDETKIVSITGDHIGDMFSGLVNISDNDRQHVNYFSKHWDKESFKPFKGKLTIEQSL